MLYQYCAQIWISHGQKTLKSAFTQHRTLSRYWSYWKMKFRLAAILDFAIMASSLSADFGALKKSIH